MTASALRRREPIRGRFFIEPSDGGWTLGDTFDGGCLEFPTRREASSYARFARTYLRRHGTISLYSAPIDLDAIPDADWIARQRALVNAARPR